jgi:glucose/mannose-6-phosphate isomerase
MLEMLRKIPDDIEAATNVDVPKVKGKFSQVVICGMGGSGIAGDIIRDYLKYESGIPVIVVKSSRLPKFVNNKTLVIAVSYSGKTWETLSCIAQAKKKKAKLIVITSGETNEKNSMIVPGGTIPRMSLSQLFFPLLSIMEKMKLIGPQKQSIQETVDILRDFDELGAKLVAEKIRGIPFIYGPEHFSSVVLRWRNQINENSKLPAHSNNFTELNHNDIEAKLDDKITVVILRDKDDEGIHIEVPKQIFKNFVEVHSQGKSLLARMFYTIYFGDWVSYFIAVQKKVDPVKNDNIDYLKRVINEHRDKK